MEPEPDLATLLRQYMDRAGVQGEQRLATMVRERVGFSLISRNTIAHWLRGDSKTVRDWRALLALGGALRLSEPELDLLLQQSRHPVLAVLWQRALPDEKTFFSPWRGRPEQWRPEDIDATGALPALTSLPPGSVVPARANPLFVGRSHELAVVADALRHQIPVVITGVGGIGKTQFALEVVHRYGRYFPGGIYWITCANAAAIPGEVALCGGADGLMVRPDFASLPLPQQVQLVRRAWHAPTPRLLVFDACDDDAVLHTWWPRTGGSRLLITSRKTRWNPTLGLATVPLNPLSQGEALDLLTAYRPNLHREEADALTSRADALPLALHVMGSYLARHPEVSGHAYLQDLMQQTVLNHSSFMGNEVEYSPTGYEPNVSTMLDQAVARLNRGIPEGERARRLLVRLAYFAPESPVPVWLLMATCADVSLHHLEQAVETGLITVGDDTVRLHQLIRTFLRLKHNDPHAQDAVETTLLTEAAKCHDAANSIAVRPWQAHLVYVTENARLRQDQMAARLCHSLGNYWRDMGNYEAAGQMLQEAVQRHEVLLGHDHLLTAEAIAAYALLLEDIGHLQDSRPLQERALAIREKHLGPRHLEVAKNLNDLGWLLQHTGDYPTARGYFERALAIKREQLSADTYSLALALNNLASLLYAMKAYREALPYYEEALKIAEQNYDPDHPALSTMLLNLGSTNAALQRYPAADAYLKRALAIRETHLGPKHPRTAHVLHNLGRVALERGRLRPAKRYLEQSLAIRRAALPQGHYQIGQSLYQMGRWYERSGHTHVAKTLYQDALSLLQEGKGPSHDDTLDIVKALARLWLREGQAGEALALLRRHIKHLQTPNESS